MISDIRCNKRTFWQVWYHHLAWFPRYWCTINECYINVVICDYQRLKKGLVLPWASQFVSVWPLLMPLTAVWRISDWRSWSLQWFRHARHQAFLKVWLFLKSWLSVIKYAQDQCLLADIVAWGQAVGTETFSTPMTIYLCIHNVCGQRSWASITISK